MQIRTVENNATYGTANRMGRQIDRANDNRSVAAVGFADLNKI